MDVLGSLACALGGHRWRVVLFSFGRTFRRCDRCGAVRAS
jgi:hypothetical protein